MWNDLYEVNKRSSYNSHIPHVHDEPIDEDPLEDIYQRVEHMHHYRQEEQGVIHPLRKQGLKLRNNGVAELFVSDDTGMRLDPNSQTIHSFANHRKSHLHSSTEWLTGSFKSYIQRNYELKIGGKTLSVHGDDIEIQGKKDASVTIDKDMNVHIKGNMNVNVDGNMNAKVRRHATIDVDEDFYVKAGRDIRLIASRYVVLDGVKIFTG